VLAAVECGNFVVYMDGFIVHKKSIEKRYGQYVSTQFDASTITGFDDQVWFSNKTHYIFIYPVLGRTACPADRPNCTDRGRCSSCSRGRP